MFLLIAAYTPHAICTGVCGAACFIADVATGTSVFHRNEGNEEMLDTWDTDPSPAELSDIHPDMDGWDDLTGVDLDGNAEDTELLLDTEDATWLHAMLYSDYAEPSDDDDRLEMNIPASVVARYGMGA